MSENVMKNTRNLNHNAKRSKRAVNILFYVLMSVIAVVLIFPFAYMLSRSLMTSEELLDPHVVLFPSIPQFGNYLELFQQPGILKGTLYTFLIVVFNMIAIPLSASVIAFSFAKLKWKGRGLMFALMLGTMMLPAVVSQIALFKIYQSINWTNTLWPMTIPNLFGGGAVNIFLLRQFMLGIPREMDNAAKIDGANAFRRYWSITLPLCKAIIIYIMVTVFISYWGDYYTPLIYMVASDAPRPLALVLYYLSTDESPTLDMAYLRMAGGVFMSLFPAILFAFFQRQLIEGVVMTGVKG